jgi:hypothetical protein
LNYILIFFNDLLNYKTMSHSVHTRIVDPIFTSKNRAEFRLDRDTMYSTDMRLLNIGTSTAPAGKKYNMLLGAEGVIQSIQLYDGNQLLSQILEASPYTAFKNLLKDNDTNISKSKQLKSNSLGFLAEGTQAYTNGVPDKDSIVVQIQQPAANAVGNKAHISLRDCLPFLRAQDAVPTNVFKRLRVIINFKDSDEIKEVVDDRTLNLLPEQGVQLVVDEITGRGSDADMKQRMEMMMGYKGASWLEVEHDRVYVDAINIGADTVQEQENTFLVTGYNAKALRRLLLVSTPLNTDAYANGNDNDGVSNQGSVASFDSLVQVRVNGSNKFSGNGWRGANRRLAHLTDTYGAINAPVVANLTGLTAPGTIMGTPNNFGGLIDYTAMRVDERVSELKITFNRTGSVGAGGDNNPKTTTALHLNMYGEVDRAVVMTGKEDYELVYA